jgi:hypothetical protein
MKVEEKMMECHLCAQVVTLVHLQLKFLARLAPSVKHVTIVN